MKKDVSHSRSCTCTTTATTVDLLAKMQILHQQLVDLTSKSLSRPQLTICYFLPLSLCLLLRTHWFVECIFVKSEEGVYSYIAPGGTTAVCGLYVIAEPDHVVEIEFENYFVRSCELGSLVSVINGWELNGQFFPGMWVLRRFYHFCTSYLRWDISSVILPRE